ncbi:Imm53 family immunity protein [Amycolatopsis sp. cmx-4-54]|uniref:Imm53 family immunity protein n=1 Tax=Amycolatopsis sp. cmx-4-54 TaxID=2790936 RepID=UPI00397B71E0
MSNEIESSFEFLQSWYADQCNGDWEHEFGIKISTLDNPGWHVVVDILETDLEGRKVERSESEPGAEGWIWSRSDGEKYTSACDPTSLAKALFWFRKFVERDG